MAQEIYHRSEWGNPTETWGNVYLNADLTNELYKRASEYENSWVTDQLLNGVGIKPSIILTPTAYEDGVLNSVKPQRTYGSELVTNGSFDTDSDWTLSEGATISGGQLNLPNNLAAYQTGIPLSTEVKFVVQGSGTVGYRLGTGIGYTQITLPKTIYTTTHSVGGRIQFYNTSGSEVIIESASLKEVIDADFDFTRGSSATRVNEQGLVEDVQILSGELVQNGDFEQIGSELVTNGGFDTDSDWTITGSIEIVNGQAVATNASTEYLYQSASLVVGKFYKITFTVSDYISGTVRSGLSDNLNNSGADRTSNGIYTDYVKFTGGNTYLGVLFTNNASMSIDNISVKEVGQNWTLTSGATIEDGQLVLSASANLYQSIPLTVGKKYRVKYEITSIDAGSSGITVYGGSTSGTRREEVGTYTEDIIQSGSGLLFFFTGGGFNSGTIDNVSVVEVTDDTDLPRINYIDGEGSLLLENQSTNLVTYSEDFSQYNYVSVTLASGYLAPDGSNTAYKVSGIVGTSNIYLSSVVSGTDTRTIWARTVSGTGTANLCSYGQNTNNNFTITEQWQRFEVNGTTTSSGAGNFYAVDFRFQEANALSELIIWGAQAEALSYATSYIPTNGSTVTRLADVCNNSGNSDLINSTEGVLYAEISALANDGTYRLMSISDGTAINRIVLGYSNGSNLLLVQVRSSGNNEVNFTYSISDITLYNKIALLYKSNEVTIWVNGVKGTSDTSASMPIGLSEFNFNYTDTLPFYGNVKCVAVFKEALSDTELEKLTTI